MSACSYSGKHRACRHPLPWEKNELAFGAVTRLALPRIQNPLTSPAAGLSSLPEDREKGPGSSTLEVQGEPGTLAAPSCSLLASRDTKSPKEDVAMSDSG